MSPQERTKLAEAWIEHSTHRIERDEDNVFHEVRGKDHFEAWETLDRLCRDDPDVCWEIILEILHTPHHESVTWQLAAGPLEDLLARHGDEFIDRVEARAKVDPTFKDLLGGVWQNATSSPIWACVESIRGEPW